MWNPPQTQLEIERRLEAAQRSLGVAAKKLRSSAITAAAIILIIRIAVIAGLLIPVLVSPAIGPAFRAALAAFTNLWLLLELLFLLHLLRFYARDEA